MTGSRELDSHLWITRPTSAHPSWDRCRCERLETTFFTWHSAVCFLKSPSNSQEAAVEAKSLEQTTTGTSGEQRCSQP